MAYFKIGTTDYSAYCSQLEVNYNFNYTEQTNARGNTVVDYINRKRKINVEIISTDDTTTKNILTAINAFSVTVKILEPTTKAEASVTCKTENYSVEYYTIQTGNVRFKKFKISFTEL